MFVFTQSNQTGMELRLDLDLQLDQIMNNGEIQNPRHIYIYIYIYICLFQPPWETDLLLETSRL
jgi:hypothetical protein